MGRTGLAKALAAALLGGALLAATLLAAALATASPPGNAAGDGAEVPPRNLDPNPCLGEHRERLRCPDLLMAAPTDLWAKRTPGGRTLLHATNNIKSRGSGPAILRGRRTGRLEMHANQHIYRVDGTRKVVRTGAELYFYPIPGQGHYWKFHQAARFELWSVDAEGRRDKLVRTGPKLTYCLRDLKRTHPSGRSPRTAVFPGCSQDSSKNAVTLGTSVGWSDIYPSTYHENLIDVTGFHGCFVFVHRADPENGIYESNEQNNASGRKISLPWGTRGKCHGG
jgi:hypothetical protein